MVKRSKLAKINFLSLAVIVLLIFIPLYPKFPLFNVPKTYVAIRVEDFLVVAVLLVWLITELRRGFPSLRDRVGQLILFYWGVGALSLISALLISKNIVPHIALLHFVRRVEYMSLFFVAFASIKETRNIRSYGAALFLATTGVIVAGFGQKFLRWPVVSTMNAEFSKGLLLELSEWARVSSTFAGHYDLAAYLVLILTLTAGFIVGIKNRWGKIMIGLLGILSLYLLVLTASRVSFVAYLAAVTLTLLGLKKYWWIGPILVVSFIGMLFSTDMTERFALTLGINPAAISEKIPPEMKVEKITTPTSTPLPAPPVVAVKPSVVEVPVSLVLLPTPTPAVAVTTELEEWRPTTEVAVEYSSGIRFDVEWPRSLRAWEKNPFLGTGYSSVTLATDNDYLRALAETGFLGSLAFLLIFLEIGRRVALYLQEKGPQFERAVVVGITGGAIGFFANAVFIDVFEASKVAFIFWLLMGVLTKTMMLGTVEREK